MIHNYFFFFVFHPSAKQFLEEFKEPHMEKYSREIDRLRPIDTQHMKEDELVNTFRSGKFIVKMCAYSFDILMSFILEKKLWIILRLINLYINPIGWPFPPFSLVPLMFNSFTSPFFYSFFSFRSLVRWPTAACGGTRLPR